MKSLRHNVAQNKLGIIFSFSVLIYMIILYLEMPEHRFEAIAFPLIFVTICSVCAVLKIILSVSNSTLLRRVDKISFIRMGVEKPPDTPVDEKMIRSREIVAATSFFVFFLSIYLIGFLFSTLIFGFLFTYLSLKKIKTGVIVSLSLVVVVYAASLLLPGGLWSGILLGA